jgi:hypothetical protein
VIVPSPWDSHLGFACRGIRSFLPLFIVLLDSTAPSSLRWRGGRGESSYLAKGVGSSWADGYFWDVKYAIFESLGYLFSWGSGDSSGHLLGETGDFQPA